ADGAAQHFRARRPIAASAVDQGQIDALRLDVADHQRREPGVIGTGQADRNGGHRRSPHCRRAIVPGAALLSEYGQRVSWRKVSPMTVHFGALIPSTNTTVEIEYNHLLPAEVMQAHYGRLMSSNHGASPFASPLDADVDYQAKLLGTARV